MAREKPQRAEISLTVNGVPTTLEVQHHWTLLQLLKQQLFLAGAKEGCGVGECGACTVMLDGRTVNACLVLAIEADGAELRTVEGEAPADELSDLQQVFVEHGAIQCGFCTPGMIMSARELLQRNAHPCREDIVEAISGNLCRCTGYQPIIDAIQQVAERSDGAKTDQNVPDAGVGGGKSHG